MMPFAKLAVTFTLTIILVIPILVTSPSLGSTMHVKSKANLLSLSYAETIRAVGGVGMQNDIADIKPTENKISSSPLPSVNQVQGTLIVTEKVVNEGAGNKKPSDFTITVHGNNPSPSSFPGSSSGTAVKLQMGMYSVTEAGPSGYNSTLSGDCSGGMMSVETKNCTITNIYSKAGVGPK
jgi:Prealbumin-like fold domain